MSYPPIDNALVACCHRNLVTAQWIVLVVALLACADGSSVVFAQRIAPGQSLLESLQRESEAGRQAYVKAKYDLAVRHMSAATSIARDLRGRQHSDYLNCLSNLAMAYSAQGNDVRAQRILQDMALLTRQRHGEESLPYALAANNLGGVCQALGDVQQAEALLTKAWEIRQHTLGPEHEDTLTSLNNLASLNLASGKPAIARRQFAEIVSIRRKTVGTGHPRYAISLNNLAAACEALQQSDEAEHYYRDALAIQEEACGADHPATATTCNNLGVLLSKGGKTEEAEALLFRALHIREQTCGPYHSQVATCLNNVAVLYRDQGRYELAADWYRKALVSQEFLMTHMFSALPHRQQVLLLGELRKTLDGYLSVAPLTDTSPDEAYAHVLLWKGFAFASRLAWQQADEHALAGELLTQLRAVSGQLSAVTLAPGESMHSQRRRELILELTAQRERIEAELARMLQENRSLTSTSIGSLQQSISQDVVLVDFLEYYRSVPAPGADAQGFQPRREVLAFIVRSEGPVRRVDLCEASELRQNVDTWRRTYGATGQGAQAGKQIRAAVWEPIVAQAGSFRTALLSPDGTLAKLPFNALPGKRRGTYLIEEFLLVTVPVPRLLPSLRTPTAKSPPQTSTAAPPRLMLLGDIAFGATGATAPMEGDHPREFSPLVNSRSEILAVRDSFERAFGSSAEVMTLRGDEATERRFGKEAPQFRYLHLVTHGFFIPSREWAEVADLPAVESGTRCGLALSQANRPRAESVDDVLEDGLLTALEVEALDLGEADLVVLSACETGLGDIAAGEGVLGLQRAFHTAGARSVVASLWKVEDRATRELMERFYENLWNAETPMSKSEALRQAQLSVLRENRQRGVSLVSQHDSDEATPRTAPYFWAAFVLSGDWR